MTLDEAIEHCKKVAKEQENCNVGCSLEHRQLAIWLSALKAITENNYSTKDIKSSNMNKKVSEFVHKYVEEHLDKSDPKQEFEVFVVWQCYILGNAKWLLSTTLPDGMYYEVTYNKVKDEFYLDAYKKFENRCIPNK